MSDKTPFTSLTDKDCDLIQEYIDRYAVSPDSNTYYAEIKPYCEDRIIYIDQFGLEHEVKPESCIKGSGCTYRKLSLAFCDRNTANQTITVIHKKRKSDVSVRKLENCYNVGYQQMYMFIVNGKKSDGTSEELPDEIEEIPFSVPSYSCEGSCGSYPE